MFAIECQNAHKTFNHNYELTVLDDINIKIKDGEFVCLAGPSGCGKSTLIKIMCGFLKPNSGTILSYGKKITEPDPNRLIVFQDGALFHGST